MKRKFPKLYKTFSNMCICVSFTTQLEILKKKNKKKTGLPTSTMFYLAPALVNMDKKCKRTGYFRKKKLLTNWWRRRRENIFSLKIQFLSRVDKPSGENGCGSKVGIPLPFGCPHPAIDMHTQSQLMKSWEARVLGKSKGKRGRGEQGRGVHLNRSRCKNYTFSDGSIK